MDALLENQQFVGTLAEYARMVGITLPVDMVQRDVEVCDSYFTASRKASATQKAEARCKRIARGASGLNYKAREKRPFLAALLGEDSGVRLT